MAEQEKDVLEEELTETSADNDECGTDSSMSGNEVCGTDGNTPGNEACGADGDASEDETRGADGESEDSKEAAGEATKADRKASKKQAKADKKTEVYREQIAQLEDKVKRQLAEFENFRHRTEKEKQSMFETGAKSVIEKILPVVDNFERGLATVPDDKKDDPFVDGMNRIYKQMLTELENMGVKPIEAVGQEFDPNLHNAVMQVESEEYETGVIAQELQKGYTYRDSVVRHSMVAVTK